MPRVQAVLVNAAELWTEFVSRGKADVMGCGLRIMSDLILHVY